MTDDQKEMWAARTVAVLYNDPVLKQQFMTAYHASSPAQIKAFLVAAPVSMPSDLADEIIAQDDQDLSNYIGKLVCNYLW